MSHTLYILDDDNHAHPVSWGDYEAWEDRIPQEERCALGKRLRVDTIGSVSVATVFLATPIGFYGRKPQLWLTLAVGDGYWEERRYSSHRAAISGHSAACRALKSPAQTFLEKSSTCLDRDRQAS